MHRHRHEHDALRHDDRHAHPGHVHRSLRLARRRQGVHRIGRRQFLTELGRGTFAIAFLGGVAACSSSDDDATTRTTSGSTTSTTAPRAATPSSPAATAASTDATGGPSFDGSDVGWAQVSLGFVSAYVLVRGSEAAVVDTGSAGSVDQIGESLATLNATFDDVRHVVLTHSHPDHVGSLPAVLERAAGATAYAGEADIPVISSPSEVTAVGDGDDVFGLQVIHTPGHTPGSISLLDPGIGLLLVGDALTGNDSGSGLAGPNEQYTPDMATANRSVVKLAGRDIEMVAMGHGQPVESGGGDLLRALADDLADGAADTSG